MKKIPFMFWVVVLLFLVNSCKMDNLDFSKLSNDLKLNPEIVAPVAKANITVWDMIQSANKNNANQITKDPSGLIKIVYKQDNLYNYNVHDFLNFPNQQSFPSENKQLGEISPGNIIVSRNITLNDLIGTLGGGLTVIRQFDGMTVPFPACSFNNLSAPFNLNQITDFTTVTISNGSLGISMENKLKVPVSVTGSFFDIGYNHEIARFTFSNVAPNGISNTSIPMAGIQISNNVEFRMISFDTPGSALPVNINLTDYIKVNFDLKDLKISSGNLKVTSQVLEGFSGGFDFVFPEAGMKAFSTVLKNGILTITTTNKSKLTGTINFTLPEIKKNGVPVAASIPLGGSSTSIDLSQTNINFSADPAHPYNRIPYIYSLHVNNSNGYINYASTDFVNMAITLNSLAFKSITGDFGKRIIDIVPGNFDMNVDLLNKIDGSFKLANPTIELFIRNSIGMPAVVNLNFTAISKQGTTATLNPPVFDIPVPASLNSGIATKSVVFDKQNSNIVNFIALPPTSQISYSGQVNFNTAVPVTPQNPNFLDINATFAIDLSMKLPLELQISNLAFKDTSALSGDYKKIESADLIINAQNGIPLDVDMQLFFLDSTKVQIGASKKMKILSAAQVDATGAITPVQSTQTFSLDQTEMDSFRKAKNIVFTGTVSSPSGGTIVAPILSDSKIDLNVVIKAKAKL